MEIIKGRFLKFERAIYKTIISFFDSYFPDFLKSCYKK